MNRYPVDVEEGVSQFNIGSYRISVGFNPELAFKTFSVEGC
jgi:hypothetical protein